MNTNFNRLFNLIIEQLTEPQKKYASAYQKMREKNMSFGPIFKQERTYFPLDIKENFQQLIPSENIIYQLDEAGFYITDYRAGIAMKKSLPGQQKDLRQIKIGKILNRLNKPELKKQFDERLGTSKKNIKNLKLQLCITYNPYDIAGMSTDRNWTSCMNLNGGAFSETAYRQVQYGGMCAYLIDTNDKKIEQPYARIAIKRMIGKNDKNSFIFVSEHLIYGDINLAEEFKMDETLEKILNQSNQQTKNTEGIFNIADKKSYSDNSYKIYYNLDQLDKIHLNSTIIGDILHKPIKLEQLQYLINNYPNLFNKNNYLWMLIAANQKIDLNFIKKYINKINFNNLIGNPNFTCNEIISLFTMYPEKLSSNILSHLFNYLNINNVKIPKLFIQKYFQYPQNYPNIYNMKPLLNTNSLSWNDIENLLNKHRQIHEITSNIYKIICRTPQYIENIPIQFLKNNIKYFKTEQLFALFSVKKFTSDEFNILINQITTKQCYHLFNIYMDNIIHMETKLPKQQTLQLLKKSYQIFKNHEIRKFNYILQRLKND